MARKTVKIKDMNLKSINQKSVNRTDMKRNSLLVTKLRPLFALSMVLTLGITTACSIPIVEEPVSTSPQTEQSRSPEDLAPEAEINLADGQYGIQQVTYDDATGEYRILLLNTTADQPSLFQTADLQMARLTDEEIANGQDNYLQVKQGQPALHLTEDFRIEYVHNVTETVTNAQTGEPETVIVERQTNFWTPFAGALAGQALGSLLFTPHYYVPPVYRPGVALVGYGSYGRTYNQAVERYQTRYKAPPTAVRNRQLRTSGQLRRSPSSGQSGVRRTTPANRSTGSGYGSDTLRRDRSNSNPTYRRSPRGFGSGGAGMRRRR